MTATTALSTSFLTIEGLAAYLNVPKATIYGWTHRKEIPHMKLGRSLRFDKAEIDSWVESKKVKTWEARA